MNVNEPPPSTKPWRTWWLLGLTVLLRGSLPLALAVFVAGALDALTILWRGGHPSALGLAVVLAGTVGLVVGLALTGLAALLAGLAWPGAWLVKRFTGRRLPLSALPALVAAVLLVVALDRAHAVFVRHVLGRYLFAGYAFAPATLGFLWADALRRRPLSRLGRALIGAAGVFTAFALHYTNSRLFVGLYPTLHESLSLASLVVLAATFAIVLSAARLRLLLPLTAGLLVLTAAAWPFARDGERVRGAVFFYGTELAHASTHLGRLLDADKDGVPRWLAGRDCDDRNAALSPMALEAPKNGRDENCNGADYTGLPADPAVDARGAPSPSPKVSTWRGQHPRPNVLLIFFDTLRADHVGALGSRLGLTPNLDAFARQAAVFEQARTIVPRTPHATMGLLRGRNLSRTIDCRGKLVSPGSETLPHRLTAQGYYTYARMVGRSWERYHLTDGFERFVQGGSVTGITGPQVTADLDRFLTERAKKSQPFFAIAHYLDLHYPYQTRVTYTQDGADLKGLYAGEVAATDHEVGRLLARLTELGLKERTVVVIFADHGENLGDHGGQGGHHGVSVFDEVVHVPLLIRVPGASPSRHTEPVSLADLAPTVLDLTGGAALPDPDGQSLAPALLGEPLPAGRYAVSEFFDFGHHLRALTVGRYKLVQDVRHSVRQLYDIAADPGETRDLAATNPELLKTIDAFMQRWVDRRAHGALRARRCTLSPGFEVGKP